MEIKPFLVEEWMNQYEVGARYNIAGNLCGLRLPGRAVPAHRRGQGGLSLSLCARRLTYGDIFGQPAFLEGICRLYRDLRPEQVIPTHGAAGANHHLFCSLGGAGDKVISVLPTYQQLYSIPDSLGAKVELLPLSPDNGFLPDLARLEKLAQGRRQAHLPEQPQQPHRGPSCPRRCWRRSSPSPAATGPISCATRCTAISPRRTATALHRGPV